MVSSVRFDSMRQCVEDLEVENSSGRRTFMRNKITVSVSPGHSHSTYMTYSKPSCCLRSDFAFTVNKAARLSLQEKQLLLFCSCKTERARPGNAEA